MMSMNKAQAGKRVTKKPVKKTTPHPNDNYKGMVDPATGKKGTMGGEGTRPPFTRQERKNMPRVGSMGSGKNGKIVKKAQTGVRLPKALQKTGKPSLKNSGLISNTKEEMSKVKKFNPSDAGFKSVKDSTYKPSTRRYKSGGSLGMKSVKSGYDNNSGVTRADFVAIGKGTAKSGTKMKKAQMGSIVNKKVGNYEPTKENIDRGFNNKSIKSKDKDYKVKVKVKNDGSIKATERRTLKGFLTGAPKAGGKLMKSGGSMKKAMNGYGGKAASMVPKAQTGTSLSGYKANPGYKAMIEKTKSKPKAAKTAPKRKMKMGGKMTKCKYGCN